MDKSLNFWIFLVIVYFFYIARKETTKGKSLSPSKPVIKDVIKNCVEPFEKGSRKPYDPVECVQQNLDEGSMLDLGTMGIIPQIQVHDELNLSIPLDKKEELIKTVKTLMETCIELRIPSKVESKIGESWGHLTKHTPTPQDS